MAASGKAQARLGVDIGGTFTDVALEVGGRRYSAKMLTTPGGAGARRHRRRSRTVLREAGLAPGDLSIIIHGTTLATNAIIERKGAKTALVTTEGFRDTVEIRHENRFEQYDVNIDLPPPLVPRRLRFVVPERIDARGRTVIAARRGARSNALAERLAAPGSRERRDRLSAQLHQPGARGAHPRHPRRAAARRHASRCRREVSPEMREYERFSTACANAYVQPMIGRYLASLEALLRARGVRAARCS